MCASSFSWYDCRFHKSRVQPCKGHQQAKTLACLQLTLLSFRAKPEALVTDLLLRSGRRAAEDWLEMKLKICLVRY
jgi:hypothetical protein